MVGVKKMKKGKGKSKGVKREREHMCELKIKNARFGGK